MKFNKFLIILFPVFLALPDLAVNLGAINLRIDDIVIYLFLMLNIVNFLKTKIHTFLKIQYYLLFYAIISLLIIITFKAEFVSNYEAIRSIGSIPYLLALPVIMNNAEYRKYIYIGTLIGGGIYIISLITNYNSILIEGELLKTAASFKREISFSSLNPNAVATLGVILGWINMLAYSENKKKYHLVLGILLLIIPFLIYARATSIGVAISLALLIILQKKNLKTYFFYLIGFFVLWFSITYFVNSELLDSATNVNLQTGEGLSGRYTLWEQGINILEKAPILGHGFCTEHMLYVKYFNGHMSHQIFIHYAIELGLINLFIFVISMFIILINRLRIYRERIKLTYIIQFSIILTFFIADMTGQLLYFNKYAYIIFAIASFNLISPNNKHVQ